MALKQFTYYNGQYITSCTGCGAIEHGEIVKIVLDGTNPDWPDFFLGTIVDIQNSSTGPTYTIAYDDSDFTDPVTGLPFPCPNPCNITIECATCCDQLTSTDILDLLTEDPAYCASVIKCIDDDLNAVIDNILTINADQVNGLCDAVIDCLDTDGDGVLDALDIVVPCDQVITCIDGDGDGVIDSLHIPAAQVDDLCDAVVDCVTDGDGSLIDTISVDTDQINNFCDEVRDCLDLNDDGIIDPTILPEARDLRDFCPSVLECLDMNDDGIIDSTILPNAEDLTNFCPAVVDCLDTVGDGALDALTVPSSIIPDFCDATIACLDTNGDNIYDAGLMIPTSSILDFCQDSLDCLVGQDIATVNAGDIGAINDDSFGTTQLAYGDTLHFFSSDNSVNFLVTPNAIDITIDQLDCQDVSDCIDTLPFDCSALPVLP